MPVHLSCFNRKMSLGSEIATQCTEETNQQEDHTNCDMQTVEASQSKERRTKNVRLWGKSETDKMSIFNAKLEGHKDGTHNGCQKQIPRHCSLITSRKGSTE